jgi:hypothetical protein
MKHLINFVVVNGQEYMISTTDTFDAGLETMVFESRNQKIINWFDVYVNHYDTVEEAIKGHEEIVENLEKYV